MKYTVKTTIKAEMETASDALKSREAALKWMEGLKSFELVEGEMEEPNSRYKMVFENKGKEMIMYETLKEFNPPYRFTTIYEMGSVWNECVSKFYEKNNETVYEMDVTFEFKGIMKLFAWIFKPMFKKQTLSGMIAFKNYVEENN